TTFVTPAPASTAFTPCRGTIAAGRSRNWPGRSESSSSAYAWGTVSTGSEATGARKAHSSSSSLFGGPGGYEGGRRAVGQQTNQGQPCRRCGILLLQRGDPCPWRGVCYFCHLDEEREKKEAKWTPEERAGPRCSRCGNPAKGTMGDSPMCPN